MIGSTLFEDLQKYFLKSLPGKTLCPSCNAPMKLRSSGVGNKNTIVEYCTNCKRFWIDPKPFEAEFKNVHPNFEKVALKVDGSADTGALEQLGNLSYAALDLPQLDDSQVLKIPFAYVSIGFTALIFAFTAAGFRNEQLMENYAFFPKYPWRSGGITFFSYSLIHTNPLHFFFGNLYYFWLFASAVELLLTARELILMLAVSSMVSAFTHGLVSRQPVIGASGVISSVMFFFICQYPNVKLKEIFTQKLSQGMVTWRIPAWLWGAQWIFLQLIMFSISDSEVSTGAHLGGATTGVLWWLVRGAPKEKSA